MDLPDKQASNFSGPPAGNAAVSAVADSVAEAEAGRQARDRMTAIVMMCLAVSLFACLDAAAKYLATRSGLPTAQIVWMRFLGQVLILLAIAGGSAGIASIVTTRRPGLQTVRSLLMLATTALNFAALAYLRLDQTLTVQFLAPLVAALLAGPLLGDWVGWRRLAAILVGFAGIVVAIRPGLVEVHPAFLLSFGCMLSYALFMLLTRHLSAIDPPGTTLFLSMGAGTVLVAPLGLMQWVWPQDVLTWVLLCVLGALGGAGHYLFILAYRKAAVSVVSPFLYFQLVAVTVVGFAVFGELPDTFTALGSLIVVASGLYLLQRERVRRRKRAR